MDTRETGQRIARARRRRGLSQAVLAGLVDRSESWLSQVERGKRAIDSHTALTRLAQILNVNIDELTGPQQDDRATTRFYSAAAQIEQAMMCYAAIEESIDRQPPPKPSSFANLLFRIRSAHRDYQATRYEETGRVLPAIIRDVEAVSRITGPGHPTASEVRTLAYDTTTALLSRVGEKALAWTAADRAMSAAEQSGQPILAALISYRLSYVLANRQYPGEAVELAMAAATALERTMKSPSADLLSVYGGLYLAAASAAAAGYDRSMTPQFLQKARDAADQLGRNANEMGTGFGPVNVAIHTMASSIRLGESRTAVEIGESLDPDTLPPALVGRRTQVHLDLAHAYAMRRQDSAAVNVLLTAERLSPQLVRFDDRTREVITALLCREHGASTPELRPLARRAGVA